jgi:hypothetical protein
VVTERGRLALGYAAAACAFLLWAGMLAGEVHDVLTDTGASSLTYVRPGPEGSLLVAGFTSGGDSYEGLRVGERVVRIGDDAVLPDAQIGFRHAIAHAGGRLTVRRDEGDVELSFPLVGGPFPFAGVVKNLFLGVFGVLALLFGPRTSLAWRTAVCAFTIAHTGGTAPIGPTPAATLALALGFSASITVVLCTGVNLVQSLTGEQRMARLLVPWLLAPVGISVASLFFGGPVPPTFAMIHLFATDLLVVAVSGVLLLRGVRRARGRRRHQLNWLLGSFFLALLLLAASWIVHAVLDPEGGTRTALALNDWIVLVPCLGILMAVLKADYAGIDRAAAMTATWAMLVVALALTFEFALEPFAGFLAASFGLAESAGQTLLIVGAALAGPKLKARLQPAAERWLAPLEGASED